MSIKFISTVPWLTLGLLWLTYALLGWYLSAHHIAWLVGAFVAVVGIAIAWKSRLWLEQLFKFGFQGLGAILIVSLITSISIALITTNGFVLVFLTFIGLLITYFSDIEMRFAGFSRINTLLTLTLLAGLGLGLGEVIDILFLPSMRY